MIKIVIKKYMTLYEFIKQIKKGKYDNTTEFICDGEKYNIDEYFKLYHCNWMTLNGEIEVIG